MTPKYITVFNQRIAYYESEGTGQTILFIHGNSCSAKTFRSQLMDDHLGRKYRLLALDLPGNGKSAAAPSSEINSLYYYAEIINAFLDALEVEDIILVGWSLGGHIALQCTTIVESLQGLLIYGTPPLDKPVTIEDRFYSGKLMDSIFSASLSEKEAEDWAATLFSPGEDVDLSSFIFDILSTDSSFRPGLGEAIAQENYEDEVVLVAQLAIPLAIVHGKDEQIVKYQNFLKLRCPTLWKNRPLLIEGAGHAIHWQQPDTFNDLLDEFVRDVLARTSSCPL